MYIKLSEYEAQPESELLKQYAQTTSSELTLSGNFRNPTVTASLSSLPRAISQVVFDYEGSYEAILSAQLLSLDYDIQLELPTGFYSADINENLVYGVANLPETVKSVVIKFNHNNSTFPLQRFNLENLIKAIQALQPHIEHLDLSNFYLDFRLENEDEFYKQLYKTYLEQKEQLFASIPETVRSLSLSWPSALHFLHKKLDALTLTHTNLFNLPAEDLLELFDGLAPNLKHFNLSDNQLNRLPQALIPALFVKLPSTLETLDLSRNGLWQTSPNFIITLFRHLPPNLEILNLGFNGPYAAHFNLNALLACLKEIPASVKELDLGGNGLLALNPDNLKLVFSALPKTVTRLTFSDKTLTGMSAVQLKEQLSLLPPQVDSLSFKGSRLFGLPPAVFASCLSNLPTTITTLDLSETELGGRSVDELKALFANIPAHVQKIKLNHNQLIKLELAQLRSALSALPQTLQAIDIADNGFDSLYTEQFEQLSASLPESVKRVSLDTKKFGFRSDGTLVPYSRNRLPTLFKPATEVIHQKEFARLRVVLMQWLELALANNLNNDVLFILFGYLFNNPSVSEFGRLINQLSVKLISSTPPDEITEFDEEAVMEAALQRIELLAEDTFHLDLGHCGLNRLENEVKIRALFKAIPAKVTSISLRHNGFQFSQETMARLPELLSRLPKNIHLVDLSGHGFESLSAQALTTLFSHLPSWVEKISLTDEKPLSLKEQVARRIWPARYQKLIARCDDDLIKAYCILKDYTKDNSGFKRFLHGHFNRHYCPDITTLVKKIESGMITTLSQLTFELEQLPLQNVAGSLSRRLAFLSYRTDENFAFEEDNEKCRLGVCAI
ncbi:leucine-rich repeat-containing protein (substrate of the Dot/Icm secretion system) [Legionella busanensis]|uniref:Leucine-rich repeat-containing protein (Substrate of the Dot/Icm secretion system) n=1 Tax=Legionella busanensis TaxID=190655 RepID=A0A378KEE0_9GAMM|nr:DUF5617 domain-containing protein [Legionella busanensis]STX81612.1 leucine-rich repeat-containing protein (substrate of the Dot/Icm secretion system) [Legionella busanensis]